MHVSLIALLLGPLYSHQLTDPVVVEWFKVNAHPLKTVAAESGFEDLQPFKKIIGNARSATEGMLNKDREDAGKQGDEYLARAQAALRAETEQARLQRRQELAGLAVSAAGKIVRKELDPGTQASLIAETLAEATSSIGRG